jgi:hypothetical protein
MAAGPSRRRGEATIICWNFLDELDGAAQGSAFPRDVV